MRVVIGITGFPGAGKDYVCGRLEHKHDFIRINPCLSPTGDITSPYLWIHNLRSRLMDVASGYVVVNDIMSQELLDEVYSHHGLLIVVSKKTSKIDLGKSHKFVATCAADSRTIKMTNDFTGNLREVVDTFVAQLYRHIENIKKTATGS